MHWLIYFLTWKTNKDAVFFVHAFSNHIELNTQAYLKFTELVI